MKIHINSRRSYIIACAESHGLHTQELPLLDILKNEEEYEYINSLQDILDSVLDLKQGDTLYFQCNRDDRNSKGIIVRTK